MRKSLVVGLVALVVIGMLSVRGYTVPTTGGGEARECVQSVATPVSEPPARWERSLESFQVALRDAVSGYAVAAEHAHVNGRECALDRRGIMRVPAAILGGLVIEVEGYETARVSAEADIREIWMWPACRLTVATESVGPISLAWCEAASEDRISGWMLGAGASECWVPQAEIWLWGTDSAGRRFKRTRLDLRGRGVGHVRLNYEVEVAVTLVCVEEETGKYIKPCSGVFRIADGDPSRAGWTCEKVWDAWEQPTIVLPRRGRYWWRIRIESGWEGEGSADVAGGRLYIDVPGVQSELVEADWSRMPEARESVVRYEWAYMPIECVSAGVQGRRAADLADLKRHTADVVGDRLRVDARVGDNNARIVIWAYTADACVAMTESRRTRNGWSSAQFLGWEPATVEFRGHQSPLDVAIWRRGGLVSEEVRGSVRDGRAVLMLHGLPGASLVWQQGNSAEWDLFESGVEGLYVLEETERPAREGVSGEMVWVVGPSGTWEGRGVRTTGRPAFRRVGESGELRLSSTERVVGAGGGERVVREALNGRGERIVWMGR
jgi:hypothetical protein